MTTFEEREHGYERKFQQEQELAFKVKARRHRLVGLWAAARLGLAGEAAETYARELVKGELEHHGDEAVINRIEQDFAAKGVDVDAARIRLEIDHCDKAAKKELGLPS